MVSKVREFGEYPKDRRIGEDYHCEICGEHDTFQLSSGLYFNYRLGVDLVQCPECGRWVDDVCWNNEFGLCKLCAEKVPTPSEIEELKRSIVELESSVKAIEESISDLRGKFDKLRFCPSCGMLALSKAEYCGICGKKL